jgi:sulfatase maturation enzyme AslB (radical SAM superfamily)
LNYTVTPRGLNDLEHAVELIKRLKLDGLRIQHYNFLTQSEFESQSMVIEDLLDTNSSTNEIECIEDLEGMAGQLISLKKQLSGQLNGIPIQWAPTLVDNEIKEWYSKNNFVTVRKCLFPWRGILVDANGKIYPCSKIYLELGDLERQNVFSAWNSETMKLFRGRLKQSLYPACSRCCKL